MIIDFIDRPIKAKIYRPGGRSNQLVTEENRNLPENVAIELDTLIRKCLDIDPKLVYIHNKAPNAKALVQNYFTRFIRTDEKDYLRSVLKVLEFGIKIYNDSSKTWLMQSYTIVPKKKKPEELLKFVKILNSHFNRRSTKIIKFVMIPYINKHNQKPVLLKIKAIFLDKSLQKYLKTPIRKGKNNGVLNKL